MKLYPIILFEKTISEVLQHYCDLCNVSAEKSYLDEEILLQHTQVIVEEYIRLFKTIDLFDRTYEYYKCQYQYVYLINEVALPEKSEHSELLKLINKVYLQQEVLTNNPLYFLPIQIKKVEEKDILLYFGLVKKDMQILKVSIIFHQTHFPKLHPELGKSKFEELHQLIKEFDILENTVSLRKFAERKGLSYQKIQDESKEVFGSTFYKAHQKVKMIAVLEDFLLTDLSHKEIAYKNSFTNYNHMYILFHRTYSFPLQTIPRLLAL